MGSKKTIQMIRQLGLCVGMMGALAACGHKELPAQGDRTLQVFDHTPVRFAPDVYTGSFNERAADSIYHLVNGRILLKRIPEQYDTHAPTTYGKIQCVLDYISGMTDVYALDLYRKITGMSLPAV